MGSGCWVESKFIEAKATRGFSITDSFVNSSTQSTFKAKSMSDKLNPYGVVRACCENEEHPNTIPIILGLDVTGSMNQACKACLDSLNQVILKLYEKFPDVEIAIAGIGDFSWDQSPFQLSQFESDIRIAENIFDLYIENGGGSNSWESYTALWYAGLYHTKLDCWNRGQKGILISLGDEMLNPMLPKNTINRVFGDTVQADVETEELYQKTSEKYDIYHIAITNDSCYYRHKDQIENSFGKVLGQNLFKSTTDDLVKVIIQIVEDSINKVKYNSGISITEDGIAW